jgi:hypothetical protein
MKCYVFPPPPCGEVKKSFFDFLGGGCCEAATPTRIASLSDLPAKGEVK